MRGLSVLFFLLLSLGPVLAQTWHMRPGDGVGPVRIGMTEEQAWKALKPWGAQREEDRIWIDSTLKLRIRAGLVEAVSIRSPILLSPTERIKISYKGVGVGSSATDVVAVLGGDAHLSVGYCGEMTHLGSRSQGIIFSYGYEPKIFEVSVERNKPYSTEELEKCLRLSCGDDVFFFANSLLHRYEQEKRYSDIRALVSDAARRVKPFDGDWLRQTSLCSKHYRPNPFEDIPSGFLDAAVEYAGKEELCLLKERLKDYPYSLPVAQIKAREEGLQWHSEPWVNLPPGVILFVRRKGPVRATPQYLLQPLSSGVEVMDFEGNTVTRVALPDETRKVFYLAGAIWANSGSRTYRIETGTWKTTRVPGPEFSVVYNGELWGCGYQQLRRLDPKTGVIRVYAQDCLNLRIEGDRLLSEADNTWRVWNLEKEVFEPTSPPAAFHSDLPPASLKLPNGAKLQCGRRLHLPDGKTVDLFDHEQSCVPEVLLDGKKLWVKLGPYEDTSIYNTTTGKVAHISYWLPNLNCATVGTDTIAFAESGEQWVYNRRTNTLRGYTFQAWPGFEGYESRLFSILGPTLNAGPRRRVLSGPEDCHDAPIIPDYHGSVYRDGSHLACYTGERGVVVLAEGARLDQDIDIPPYPAKIVMDSESRQRELAKSLKLDVADPRRFAQAMKRPNPYVRVNAVKSLPSKLYFPAMVLAARDENVEVRQALKWHLGTLDKEDSIRAARALTDVPYEDMQSLSANLLSNGGGLASEARCAETLERGEAWQSLTLLIVEKGSEKLLEKAINRGRFPSSIGAELALGKRLQNRPDLALQLIKQGDGWLLWGSGEGGRQAVKIALESSDNDVRERGLEAAMNMDDPSLWPYVAEAFKRLGNPSWDPAWKLVLAYLTPERLKELLRGGFEPGSNQRRELAERYPECLQDIFIKVGTSFSYRREDDYALAAAGLAHGPDRERCVKVLRQLMKYPELVPSCQVSLMAQGDEQARRWVEEHPQEALPFLADLPARVSLDFLKPHLAGLEKVKDNRTIFQRLGTSPHAYLITPQMAEALAASSKRKPVPGPSVRGGETAADLWSVFEKTEDLGTALDALIALSERKDDRARARLCDLIGQLHSSDQVVLLAQKLPRLSDMGFLKEALCNSEFYSPGSEQIRDLLLERGLISRP